MKVLPNGLALSELSTAWQYIYFSIFTKGSSHLWVLRHLSANLTASLCVRRESYYSAQVPIITVISTHGDSNFLNGLSEQENLDVVMPRESPEEDTWPQRPAPQRVTLSSFFNYRELSCDLTQKALIWLLIIRREYPAHLSILSQHCICYYCPSFLVQHRHYKRWLTNYSFKGKFDLKTSLKLCCLPPFLF